METIYSIKWLFKSHIKANRMNFAFFSDFNSFKNDKNICTASIKCPNDDSFALIIQQR